MAWLFESLLLTLYLITRKSSVFLSNSKLNSKGEVPLFKEIRFAYTQYKKVTYTWVKLTLVEELTCWTDADIVCNNEGLWDLS